MYILDLFCGAGVAHRGFPASAVSVGVDFDSDAVASFRHYLGSEHCTALCADLSIPRVRAELAASVSAPDLVWASPPCQPFSAAGRKRGAADKRNGYPWTFDLLRRLVEASKRPRLVCIENVRGLTFHRCHRGYSECNGCYLQEQIDELEKLFRYVRAYTLNAADYGAPQIRRRVFVMCSDDLLLVQPPKATHCKPDQVLQIGREPWRTVRQALPHLDETARVIGGGSNPHYAGEARKHSDLTDRPSTTIAAHHGGGAGNAGPWVVVGDKRRRLTVLECALLQGLDDDPTLPTQTKRSRYRQVGNGVPPQLVSTLVSQLH